MTGETQCGIKSIERIQEDSTICVLVGSQQNQGKTKSLRFHNTYQQRQNKNSGNQDSTLNILMFLSRFHTANVLSIEIADVYLPSQSKNKHQLSTLQISTAKLQLYYDKKDILWILLRQLAVYQNLLYPYFLKVIFATTNCHRKYDF